MMAMFTDFEERNLIKINFKHFYFCLNDSVLIERPIQAGPRETKTGRWDLVKGDHYHLIKVEIEVNSSPTFAKDQFSIPNFKTRVVPMSWTREPRYTKYCPKTSLM